MGKVEPWIRQKLAAAVAAGNGRWSDSFTSALGKAIYHVADRSMSLTLSAEGFKYEGLLAAVECRYDQVERLELATLYDVMKLRGDLGATVKIAVVMRDASPTAEMRWPLRVYSNAATVLDHIVRELT